MIVTARLSWLELLLTVRGSIFPKIAGRLAVVTLVSLIATIVYRSSPSTWSANLTPLPFTLIGFALSIFLGFRNNTSYDRFWEGRKLWGRMVNATRTCSRQVLSMVDIEDRSLTERQRILVMGVVAYVHAFRARLRGEDAYEAARPFIPEAWGRPVQASTNPPIRVLQCLSIELGRAAKDGGLDPLHLPALDSTFTEMTAIQGGCERIRNTPIPFAYTALMHRIVGTYCITLPFGILSSVGSMTPFVVILVGYALLGLDAIGDEIEEPFGYDANDLPLSQLSRVIERDLRSSLDDTEVPEPWEPVKGVLS